MKKLLLALLFSTGCATVSTKQTKFHNAEKVSILIDFYKDCIGTVIDYYDSDDGYYYSVNIECSGNFLTNRIFNEKDLGRIEK